MYNISVHMWCRGYQCACKKLKSHHSSTLAIQHVTHYSQTRTAMQQKVKYSFFFFLFFHYSYHPDCCVKHFYYKYNHIVLFARLQYSTDVARAIACCICKNQKIGQPYGAVIANAVRTSSVMCYGTAYCKSRSSIYQVHLCDYIYNIGICSTKHLWFYPKRQYATTCRFTLDSNFNTRWIA